MASKRPRTERRSVARETQKQALQRRKLFQSLPGGSAELPLQVTSASVIEPRAESLPCALCQAACVQRSHTATALGPRRLRVVTLNCRACGEPQVVYFEILQAN
jgi:hypothetical protein